MTVAQASTSSVPELLPVDELPVDEDDDSCETSD
jgi:hypothetical protein